MNVELVDFEAADGVLLNGFMKRNHSHKMIISTHGMGSDCFKIRDRVICEEASKVGIDYFCYNNRGSYQVRTVKKNSDGKSEKMFAGTSLEDVEEGYFDIKGAIQKAIDLGYTEIYLQGHSLGATKTLYTYTKLKEENDSVLKYIKGVILLSLVDIPRTLQIYSGEKYETFKNYAESKEKENKLFDFMPLESFIQPISVKTYLKYVKYYQNIDFARYNDNNYNFKELNSIDVPLFMRFGNVGEMIEQDAKELTEMLNKKVNIKDKNIGYIDGATHSYDEKEKVLAEQIVAFLA